MAFKFHDIQYTIEDIKIAIEDLDNNKYTEYETEQKGTDYNFISPKGIYYGPKRIIECIYKNKTNNMKKTPVFGSTKNLRNNIQDAGFQLIKVNAQENLTNKKLLDVIKISEFNLSEKKIIKIRYNKVERNENQSAISYIFSEDQQDTITWLNMNAYKNRSVNLDNAEYLIACAEIQKSFFLFEGIYKVKTKDNIANDYVGVAYDLERVNLYQQYNKKLIIKLLKPLNNYCPDYSKNSYNPIVFDILDTD